MASKVHCLRPTIVDANDTVAVEKMLISHEWTVREAKNQESGIQIAYQCKNCGTELIGIAHWIARPDIITTASGT